MRRCVLYPSPTWGRYFDASCPRISTLVSRPDGDRFDRIVRVDVPDAAGREAILKVHTRKMKIDDVDVLQAVAELTPGEF